MLDPIRVTLMAVWVMLMLSYLLGDVLRLFSGSITPGEIEGRKITQNQWLLISILMTTPIVLIFLTLILPYPAARIVNIGMAGFWFIFNIIGLPTYPMRFDKYLNVFGLVLNAITIWYAWQW